MSTPSTKQLKESPRNHRGGIAAASPVIPQTTPKNIAARAVNGINTGYFIGCRAKMIKYTPVGAAVADTKRTTYTNSGESGRLSESVPKNLAMDSHAEIGRNNPNPDSRQPMPAIHRQIFNERIHSSFQ